MGHGSHDGAEIDNRPVDHTVFTDCLDRYMVIVRAEEAVEIDARDPLKNQSDGPGGEKPFDLNLERVAVLFLVQGAVPGDVELIGNLRAVL